MPACGTTRQHGVVVGALYYVGFFLLFFCLGTFGSAGLITYKATKWPEATAQIQDCSLGEYAPRADEGSLYNLHCGISYGFAGHSFKTSLQTNLTRSIAERHAIKDWVADNRSATVSIRVNPKYPEEFVVTSYLPGKRGDNAGDFINAAIVMGSVSGALLATARTLVRRGW